jgi:hypothetical protein
MRRSGPDGTRFSPAEDDAVRSRPRANFPVWTATLPASARNRALGFRVERLRRGRVLEDFCEAQSRIVQRCARCSDSLEAAISLCRSRGGAIFFFEKCAILFLKIKLRAILYDRLVYSDHRHAHRLEETSPPVSVPARRGTHAPPRAGAGRAAAVGQGAIKQLALAGALARVAYLFYICSRAAVPEETGEPIVDVSNRGVSVAGIAGADGKTESPGNGAATA